MKMKNWYVVLCLAVLSCTSLNNPFDETSPNHADDDALRQYVGMDSVKIVIETVYYDTVTHVDTVTFADTTWYAIDTSANGDTVITRVVTVYDTTIYVDTIKVVDGLGGTTDTVRDTVHTRDTIRVRDTVRVETPPTIKTSKPSLNRVEVYFATDAGNKQHNYNYAPLCTLSLQGEQEGVANVVAYYSLAGCTRYNFAHSDAGIYAIGPTTYWGDKSAWGVDGDAEIEIENYVNVGNHAWTFNAQCVAPDTSKWAGWSTVYLRVTP